MEAGLHERLLDAGGAYLKLVNNLAMETSVVRTAVVLCGVVSR